jgi:uncharacterized protein YecT (DUF1311 family)
MIKMTRWLVALAVCIACASALLASPSALAQADAACKAAGTLEGTNACAVQSYQAVDTEIAILYGDVMRALAAHERPQLRQEQTNWQRERLARCKQTHRAAESEPEWQRLYHECLKTETEARRRGLMRWLTLDHPSAKP